MNYCGIKLILVLHRNVVRLLTDQWRWLARLRVGIVVELLNVVWKSLQSLLVEVWHRDASSQDRIVWMLRCEWCSSLSSKSRVWGLKWAVRLGRNRLICLMELTHRAQKWWRQGKPLELPFAKWLLDQHAEGQKAKRMRISRSRGERNPRRGKSYLGVKSVAKLGDATCDLVEMDGFPLPVSFHNIHRHGDQLNGA